MRPFVWLPLAGMMLAVSAPAQEAPRAEISAAFSFSRVEAGRELSDADLYGWNVSVTGNLNSWFGLTADVAGHYGSILYDTGISRHSFHVGPRVAFRGSDRKVIPFVHALFGSVRAHRDVSNPPLGSPLPVSSADETAFSTVLGGGIDFVMTRRLALRLIQADYLVTRFDEASGIVCIQSITTPCPTTKAGTQDNLRLSFGVTLHFGKE